MSIPGIAIGADDPLRRALAAAFCVLVVFPTASLAQDRWDEALRSVPKLAPSTFPELSTAIVSALEDRDCAIPQTYYVSGPQNVISGHFASADTVQIQWAVLCTAADTSEIVIVDASAEQLLAFQRTPDRQWLQDVGGDQIGYSRLLRTISRDQIVNRVGAPNGGMPAIAHDGIEEVFTEKGSVVWYWDRGSWMALPGVD